MSVYNRINTAHVMRIVESNNLLDFIHECILISLFSDTVEITTYLKLGHPLIQLPFL